MITIENLCKSYSNQVILDEVSFNFPSSKRIALIGANGAGKTTLLKILTGEEDADSGKILIPKRVSIGHLPQEPNDKPAATIIDEALLGRADLVRLEVRIEKLLTSIASNSDADSIQQYEELEAQFKNLGGYTLKAKASRILVGLGIPESKHKRSPLDLSGGQRMRLELAKIFIKEPEFLILDEPTNHLDLPSLVWVENFLKSFRGTVLFVSHDRSLLNNLGETLIHLDKGKFRIFQGNFDAYLHYRDELLEQEQKQLENLQKKKQNLETFINRFGAKASKATQAKSKLKQLNKLEALEQDYDLAEYSQGEMQLSLPVPRKSHREVLTTDQLSVGYDAPLIHQVNLLFERSQKIAIIGANGKGKSTFLKTVMREVPKLGGNFDWGQNTDIAYFSQNHTDTLNINNSVVEEILATNAEIGQKEAYSILGRFLFSGEAVEKKVQVLSGGEKARLSLAKLLTRSANTIVLDEPTNHLDMTSIEILSQALSDYEGTVICVSHSRDFIDNFCTHILAVTDDSKAHFFEGKLEDYQRAAAIQGIQDILKGPSPELDTHEQRPESKQKGHAEAKELKRKRNSLTKKLDNLTQEQEALQNTIQTYENEMTKVSPENYTRLNELQSSVSEVNSKLEKSEENWLDLSEELEGIENSLRDMGRLK